MSVTQVGQGVSSFRRFRDSGLWICGYKTWSHPKPFEGLSILPFLPGFKKSKDPCSTFEMLMLYRLPCWLSSPKKHEKVRNPTQIPPNHTKETLGTPPIAIPNRAAVTSTAVRPHFASADRSPAPNAPPNAPPDAPHRGPD